MTKESFLEQASALGIPSDAYALDGGHPSETLVLDRRGPVWCVYYSERGLERDTTAFHSETAAYDYLLQRLQEIIPTLGR